MTNNNMKPSIVRRIKRSVKRISFNLYTERINKRSRKKNITRIAVFTILGENWNSFKTMYYLAKERQDVNMSVYVFPKYVNGLLEMDTYKTTLDFFDRNNIEYTPAYSIETKKWIDVSTFNYDFLFYDEPYNVFYGKFSVENMYKKSRICYIPYGYSITESPKLSALVMSEWFCRYISYFFQSTQFSADYMQSIFKIVGNKNHRIVDCGYPRFDLYKFNDFVVRSPLTIMWIPRYTLNDSSNNELSARTTFFAFKDLMIHRAYERNDENWIVRPHPAALKNFIEKKVMTEEEVTDYIARINALRNMSLDKNKNYMEAFEKSDVLLADFSSLIVEYMLTGKPVIYCGDLNAVQDNSLKEAMYIAGTWEEVISSVDSIKQGQDPLYLNRRKYVSKIQKGGNAGRQILEFLIQENQN